MSLNLFNMGAHVLGTCGFYNCHHYFMKVIFNLFYCKICNNCLQLNKATTIIWKYSSKIKTTLTLGILHAAHVLPG